MNGIMLAALAYGTAVAPAAAPPADLAKMRQALSHAVGAHDRGATAALMTFPLSLDQYGSGPILSKADFLKKKDNFGNLFGGGEDPALVQCIASGPLTLQTDKTQYGAGAWVVDCNGNDYYFGRRGGNWLMTGYQNINE
jgi:hypothetical protein